eukprot:109787-Pelagomonas_calceolata.AAC.5
MDAGCRSASRMVHLPLVRWCDVRMKRAWGGSTWPSFYLRDKKSKQTLEAHFAQLLSPRSNTNSILYFTTKSLSCLHAMHAQAGHQPHEADLWHRRSCSAPAPTRPPHGAHG